MKKVRLLKKVISIMLVILFACISLLSDTLKVRAEESMEYYAPVFNVDFYKNNNPDVVNVYGDGTTQLFNHFLEYGMAEGRQGSEEFNVYAYKDRYADLRAVFGNDLQKYYIHYIEYGKEEGRNGRVAITGVSVQGTADDGSHITIGGSPLPVTQVYNANDYEFNGFLMNYYNKSVFVGDSIMLGFRNYAMRQEGSYLNNVKFLAAGSYSLANALKPLTPDSLHPTYMGEKRYVWDSVSMMDVDKVFIMFGTNDIAVYGLEGTLENYVTFVGNIKELSPNVEIHIISMTYTLEGAGKTVLNNDNIRQFNTMVRGLCSANGWIFHDLATEMADGNGNLYEGYCSDGFIHINNSGYTEVWEPFFANYAYGIYVGGYY